MATVLDKSYGTPNYETQGGAVWEIGGTLDIARASGGKLTIDGVDATPLIAGQIATQGAGSTLALTVAANNKQTIKLDTAGGSAVTLPPATGSGASFKFIVSVLATSAAHVVSAAGTDVMIGAISGARIDSGNAVLGFAAQSTSNTITLNRTTTGSVSLGEYLSVEDVAAGIWEVSGFLTATGAAFATPFSHV